ncbi:agmatinase [Aphanomyces invadans]|uniref:Agmatinase n=2 Tax=Aphanomyces invadans TaxID=157072 RepID=A0A024TIH7_9STRA|nr:agmatinase [Aphanomyces invadans]ETV93804.1 agmatinase [Aphanomyces invadans]|eukprot:XP_008877613.1 agmatinase [Aphanomyces invadans]
MWNPRVKRAALSVLPSFLPSSSSTIAILGANVDANSSFLTGSASAPDAIRTAFHSDSANGFSECGMNLMHNPMITDMGNLTPTSASMSSLSAAAQTIVSHDKRLLTLGGDHSITYPLVKGVRRALCARGETRLNILHLDAHSDLYEYDILNQNNRYSHASPFARIMEEGLCSRLVQVGIRTHTQHTREQAAAYSVETYDMRSQSLNWPIDVAFDGPVYVTVDLDVLDPAFAPGVSHHEPGGLSTRQVLSLLQTFRGNVVASDVVELNPSRDIGGGHVSISGETSSGMTAMVAAKVAKELLARMLKAEGLA